MPAIIMKCINVERHPNANILRLYKFEGPNYPDVQIVANLDNIYNVNDKVIIVLAGSTMKDGTQIKITKLRGVPSYGMALGHSTEEVGTDVSDVYCQPVDLKRGAKIILWPDIESLFNVRRTLKQTHGEKTIIYRAKVKLDGTNAGINLFADGRIVPQSRSRIIDPEHDNMNFAKWTVLNYEYFEKVRNLANKKGYVDQQITVFGEFCGQGIMKRTAISKLDHRILAIFAIQIEPGILETEPDKLREIFPAHDQVFVLPWLGEAMSFSFDNITELEKQVEQLNAVVHEVEQCDPFAKETFNLRGIGEGVVMYPIINGSARLNRWVFADLVFKAKGEKHKVVKSKKPVQIDPEFVRTIDKFVELFVTENRLDQIAQKVLDGKSFSPQLTGLFIKAFGQDVLKESKAELEASGLEWKQVAKEINSAAAYWWTLKCNSL